MLCPSNPKTRLRTTVLPLGLALIALVGAQEPAAAQQAAAERLPPDVSEVVPPSARVRGVPGAMTVQPRACRALPTGDTRRRIVDVAAQEWGFFGFRVAAPTDGEDDDGIRRGRRSRLPPAEASRVAASIAGYWAVTPEGSWIVERQNDRWDGPDGIAARWNAPWSAAFVSWVMCEAGLGATTQFQRAIAHHTYIDQAIRARDGRAPQAAFVAYDPGETAIAPGDLLCSSRRPAYRTIAERRRQMGVGARSHCDVVVKVDEVRERIHAIGGNVRGVVSLKQLPAVRESGRPLRPATGGGERPMFAHLKLRAAPIDANALDASPTIAAPSRRDALPAAQHPRKPGAQLGS
ncbi:MAG TPA: DUF2272 domain-containing protein [Vicinamibacterales bacterium]